ncbi:UNVERIFIED_ORG: protein-tyrosine-phosphatase [Burkholderia sp. 1263]
MARRNTKTQKTRKDQGYGVSVTKKYKVLFLCRENSARSIVAEALLRELAGHRFDAFSAGPEPAAAVHPFALAQLRPGISELGALSPKSWLEFTGEWAPRMDLVIAMDERVAGHHAPLFPGEPELLNWAFADPLADGVSDAQRLRLFEKMFWQIVRRVSAFIALPQYAAPMREAASRIEAPARDSGILLAQ